MSIAIIPGSFDPMTLGHVDVVERASKMFDEVVVAVMINPQKDYRFTVAEKTELAALSCAHIPNARVISDEGMLIDLVDKLNACAIIKGIRTIKDFRYEQTMAYWNRAHNPAAETLYLPCNTSFARISSTLVRKRMEEGKTLEGLVSPVAIKKLVEWGVACPAKKRTSKF